MAVRGSETSFFSFFDGLLLKQKEDRIPLRVACERGDVEMVKILIEKGADETCLILEQVYYPNRGTKEDRLIFSCANYSPEIISFLVKRTKGVHSLFFSPSFELKYQYL